MTSWLFVYTSVLLTAVHKMANRVGLNKNVSTSALTRAKRAQINELEVLPIEPLSRYLVLVLRYHIQQQQPAAAAMVTYLQGRLQNHFPRRCVSSRNVEVLIEHKLPIQTSK